MKRKEILCDSSALISLTASCFTGVLNFLHHRFNVDFIISPTVEYECVTRPLESKSREHTLSALRIKEAIQNRVIIKIDADVGERTQTLEEMANKVFFVKGQGLRIAHKGETELLALSKELGINNLLMDERTTRILIEAPFKYKTHLEEEFKVNVMLNKKNLLTFQEMFANLGIIRSTELLILAYENGMMNDLKDLKKPMLEAGLFGLKYSGCAIRSDEIEAFMRKLEL